MKIAALQEAALILASIQSSIWCLPTHYQTLSALDRLRKVPAAVWRLMLDLDRAVISFTSGRFNNLASFFMNVSSTSKWINGEKFL